ncbi:MAG TPA: hypothetical protein VFS12_09135 [Terriglobia bacterium]|nr:hypothetical protein [Terriglobia bacterium]
MVEELTKETLAEFLARKPYSVIHVDASWDGYRGSMARNMDALRFEFHEQVSFGYINCDTEQDFARGIGLLNVPSVAYYRGDRLFALVIGQLQNVRENIKRKRCGDALDTTNPLSRE